MLALDADNVVVARAEENEFLVVILKGAGNAGVIDLLASGSPWVSK